MRRDKFPHIWCTGCGCGIILKAILRAIDRSKLSKDGIALVSGIGCSSRTPGYVDFNTLHTTHGRAIAFATGLKLVKPELKVIVVSGDGDATAIGGNHFIHAARRNVDMTVIIYNNHIYGMTGGQASPTTPAGMKGSTAPYGNIEPAFDISGLAIAAGASFVARSTCYHATHLDKLIQKGLSKKGFSVIEVLSPCPTYYARPNRLGTSVEMLKWYRDNSIPVETARKMPDEKRQGKIMVGVLHDTERSEFCTEYQKLIERVKKL
ncbi:2-oxoacid:ferredoxin oxidoreductase subunit beta [candidate division TA06 bacterium DG_78]|uniref:2-oxoacid:ferredoxin oxidoreductase subunit beta n=1 Tax=candidate division TA06 bacterium DG_78 TaxID=1703772 RepID=A0A0S7YCB6_UNCT6|nr:MAG: 2-oxoacid:ferredoxin oxidoreductase subunit beta [candidate division TA06 bacterium DG_78]